MALTFTRSVSASHRPLPTLQFDGANRHLEILTNTTLSRPYHDQQVQQSSRCEHLWRSNPLLQDTNLISHRNHPLLRRQKVPAEKHQTLPSAIGCPSKLIAFAICAQRFQRLHVWRRGRRVLIDCRDLHMNSISYISSHVESFS